MVVRSGMVLSRWQIALLVPVLALSLSVAAASALVIAYQREQAILPGVRLSGIPVGRLDPATAARLVQERLPAQPAFVFTAAGRTLLHATYEELGIELDVPRTIAAAQAVGRAGPAWERLQGMGRALLKGANVRPVWRVDEARLRARLGEIAAELGKPPQRARLVVDGRGQVRIEPHTVSFRADPERMRAAVLQALAAGSARVELPGVAEEPALTAGQLREWGVDTRLAVFETRFNPAERNRAVNIRLAAEALDGTVVPPGGVLSFNRVVGPRTVARGYLPAPVIINGRFQDDFGGGVCQVSSTLYNAGLLAGLQVVERTRHSLPVSYVPPGKDAAVVYGAIDLKLRNPFPGPVVVQTEIDGGRLRIEIYGGGRRPSQAE